MGCYVKFIVCVLAAAAGIAVAAPAKDERVAQPMLREALQTPRALHGMMLGLSHAGSRLVTVGERGSILISDDDGAKWRQVPSPVSVTLTAVRFADERRGWAVGHSGVVLHTKDGGEHWERQLDGIEINRLIAQKDPLRSPSLEKRVQQLIQDGADKPLLDLLVRSPHELIVVGAYGLALRSMDGGVSWSSLMSILDNPKGLHLNAISGRASDIVIVGEQGIVLKSSDGGVRFSSVALEYVGSLFAVAMPPDGSVCVTGLRGNIFRASDISAPFTTLSLPIPVTVGAIAISPDGGLVLGNQAGAFFSLAASKSTFIPLLMRENSLSAPMMSALVSAGNNAVVAVGAYGPVRLVFEGVK